MTPRGALAVPILLLVLAACASSPAGSGGADAGERPSDQYAAKDDGLRGRTFVSTAVTVDGEPRPLVGGTSAVVGFTADGLTLHAGCNQMFARAGYGDGHLVVAGVGGTEMGCARPLMGQDAWLARFLTDDPRYTLDGDILTLTGAGATITLEPQAGRPDAELVGTRWQLDGIVDGSGPGAAVGSIPAGIRSDLRIVDGSLELHTGCNWAGGTADVSGSTVTVSIRASTDVACGPSAAPVEAAVLEVLQRRVAVSIDGDALTMTRAGAGLVYRAN